MEPFRPIRPDTDQYALRARRVARMLFEYSKPVYLEVAHRSSLLRMSLATRDALALFAEPGGMDDGPWLLVSVLEHGAYWFAIDRYQNPGYVAEKLGVAFGDGETIAEFLTRLGAVLKMKELA